MTLAEEVAEILKGIDKTEDEDQDGWWPTNVGASFGAARLKEILDRVEGK